MHWLRKEILQNIILVKNSFFAYLHKTLLWIKENLSEVQKHFTFSAISVLKKVNLNVWQTCHNLFEISGVPVWFRSHHIFECFPLGVNRARTMSHQTAPHPPLQAALPPCVWQHNLHPFEREKLVWLNNHTYVKNQRENLYGWGTIICKTTTPKPHV